MDTKSGTATTAITDTKSISAEAPVCERLKGTHAWRSERSYPMAQTLSAIGPFILVDMRTIQAYVDHRNIEHIVRYAQLVEALPQAGARLIRKDSMVYVKERVRCAGSNSVL